MNICSKCGGSLVWHMYWSCGGVYVEWYCPRCDNPNVNCTYTTSNTQPVLRKR